MSLPQIVTGVALCCVGYAVFGVGTAALVWCVREVLAMKQRGNP